MRITSAQFKVIEDLLPVQWGNVSISNRDVLNAIQYVAEHGCKWRGLPKTFGNWHTIYTRANRWARARVLDRVFATLQEKALINVKIEHVSLDSTLVKVHPDGSGALKKNGVQSIGKSRGGWTTKIHLVASDARTAVAFSLSPGQVGDAPEGRALLKALDAKRLKGAYVVMDKAYEGDETRQLVFDLGMTPVVPPKENRIAVWEYDREMYTKSSGYFIQKLRRIFSRFDKLDVVFRFFINFSLIVDRLISVNRP